MQKYYDIIMIGTSAVAGTLAYALASIGKRFFVKHNTTKLYAISTVTNKTVFQKILAINGFYFGSTKDAKSLDSVRLMGKHKWEIMRPDFPRWVANSFLKVVADRFVDCWMQSEDLPNVEDRVEIAKNKQIKVYYRPNNQKALRHLRHQFEKVLRKVGFPIIVGIPMLLKVMNQQGGTFRFGSDSTLNVLDLNFRTHDIDNLYVVDSIFFPSIGAMNLTLTHF